MKKKAQEKDLDNPRTTLEHGNIILRKPFLKHIYTDWYTDFINVSKSVNKKGLILELGSGGGFLKTMCPDVITSDILELPHVDLVCNAENMPFEDNSIACIMMLNVFHHIPRPNLFLQEAQRTLIEGGKVIMIEPANTLFSRFIYKNFHHEPFDPEGSMEIAAGSPLSNSNQAFSYIYFEREKSLFDDSFPFLQINRIEYHTPLRYLLSGGLSGVSLLPGSMHGIVKSFEKIISPLSKKTALFSTIEIEKHIK